MSAQGMDPREVELILDRLPLTLREIWEEVTNGRPEGQEEAKRA